MIQKSRWTLHLSQYLRGAQAAQRGHSQELLETVPLPLITKLQEALLQLLLDIGRSQVQGNDV